VSHDPINLWNNNIPAFKLEESQNVLSNSMSHVVDFYFNSVEYIFKYSTKTFSYDFELTCFDFMDTLNVVSNDFFLNIFIELCWDLSAFQLFFSVILDIINTNNIYKHFFSTEWYRVFISHQTYSLYLVYHPEFAFFWKNTNTMYDTLGYTNTRSYISIYDYVNLDSWITPTLQFVDMLFLFYGISIILVFYFSYYSSANKENSTVDSDYLSAWILTESEKEIGSLDDLLLAILIVAYVFGWFFYTYVWGYLGQYPEFLLSFYLAPFLFFVIIGMPTLLMFDFGSCFLAFIRGSAASQVLLAELMYDYINVGAFYVRLCVQFVRLLIMFLTFAAMNDVFLLNHYLNNSSIGSFEHIWEEVLNTKTNFESTFYLISDLFPRVFIRVFFEVAHTLAVCSIQFGAFFAIVFWFFLFLYTFFCGTKLELYFYEKRIERKNNLNQYEKLK